MGSRRDPLVGMLLALAACGGVGEAVKVQRTSGASAEPRPKGCAVEMLYHPPTRPYLELGELTSLVTKPPGGDAVEVLKGPACELGADAVIVTRRFPANHFDHMLVAGTAIKYLDTAPPRPDEPSHDAVPGSVAL